MPASTSTPAPAPSLETAVNAADPNRELATQQAAGLRALANMIEANPELVRSFDTTLNLSGIKAHLRRTKDAAELGEIARIAKRHGAKVTKVIDSTWHNLLIDFHGVKVEVLAYRSDVCERVVTGTETVTRRVSDPNVDVPLVEVTETVEKVEWVCKPLLASKAVSR